MSFSVLMGGCALGTAYVRVGPRGAGKGRHTRIVCVPLASITKAEYESVDVRFSSLSGIVVTTSALGQPLEICPAEHILDYRSSAERLGRHLTVAAS